MNKSIGIVALACLAFCSLASWAQVSFPNKTVQLIVPYPAGGAQDIISRRLAEKFHALWAQPVVVVNKPGANGVVAWQSLLTTKPDGYNLIAPAGQGLVYVHMMNSSIASPFLAEFTPVAAYASYPMVFLVSKDLPITSLRELAAYAIKNPKALSSGTTPVGTAGHLLFELYKSLGHVPDEAMPVIYYDGIAPIITALMGKQIQVALMPLNSLATKQIDAGLLRGLAVTAPNRSPFRKDIPTVVEDGFPDLVAKDYLSYWVIANTPPAIVKKLSDTTHAAVEDPAIRNNILGQYFEAEFLDSAELRKQFELRLAQFGPLIKRLNIKAQ